MQRFNLLLLLVGCWAATLGRTAPLGTSDDNHALLLDPELFQGDILGITPGKNAILNPARLWPDGVIPYDISPEIFTNNNGSDYALLSAAFDEYAAKTCLRFVPRTDERNYIHIVSEGMTGCSSYVGMIGLRQRVSLMSAPPGSPTCFYQRGVLHELMHAAGFYHEQSRTDRDDYVIINWSNIIPGYENNFNKYDETQIQTLGAPYDYVSIMHYGAYDFAADPTIPTIIVPENVTIGAANKDFSEVDLFKLNALYNCPTKQ